MKKTVAAITALIMLLLCSCALKNEPLQPADEQTGTAVGEAAETASAVTEEPTEEAQPAEAVIADKAGFDYMPGATPQSGGFDISDFFKNQTDLFAFGADRENYFEKRFESLYEEYGAKTVAGALCRVTVKDVKTADGDDDNGDGANSAFKFYKATAVLEIEKIVKAAGAVDESSIKEGETVEAGTVYGFVYEGGEKTAGRAEISLPVPEAGSEYLAFIVDSFGENGYIYAFIVSAEPNEIEISEEYKDFYKDVYPALEDAFNKAKEYLNGFLRDFLSDHEREEPTFEIFFPST